MAEELASIRQKGGGGGNNFPDLSLAPDEYKLGTVSGAVTINISQTPRFILIYSSWSSYSRFQIYNVTNNTAYNYYVSDSPAVATPAATVTANTVTVAAVNGRTHRVAVFY